MNFTTQTCSAAEFIYAPQIVEIIRQAHYEPGTALSLRSIEDVEDKMRLGRAIIALTDSKEVCGFLYIWPWEDGKFISTSALVVPPAFRGHGIARKLKEASLELIKKRFPDATAFGLTLSSSIMKLNAALGFIPVAYDEITQDDKFWEGCRTCPYHDTLITMKRERCFCTAMKLKKK